MVSEDDLLPRVVDLEMLGDNETLFDMSVQTWANHGPRATSGPLYIIL